MASVGDSQGCAVPCVCLAFVGWWRHKTEGDAGAGGQHLGSHSGDWREFPGRRGQEMSTEGHSFHTALKRGFCVLATRGSVVESDVHAPEGCGFQHQSGHRRRLQVQHAVRVSIISKRCVLLSHTSAPPSLVVPPFLSL